MYQENDEERIPYKKLSVMEFKDYVKGNHSDHPAIYLEGYPILYSLDIFQRVREKYNMKPWGELRDDERKKDEKEMHAKVATVIDEYLSLLIGFIKQNRATRLNIDAGMQNYHFLNNNLAITKKLGMAVIHHGTSLLEFYIGAPMEGGLRHLLNARLKANKSAMQADIIDKQLPREHEPGIDSMIMEYVNAEGPTTFAKEVCRMLVDQQITFADIKEFIIPENKHFKDELRDYILSIKDRVTKRTILKAALNPDTELGKVFHAPRNILLSVLPSAAENLSLFKPQITKGTLKQLHDTFVKLQDMDVAPKEEDPQVRPPN